MSFSSSDNNSPWSTGGGDSNGGDADRGSPNGGSRNGNGGNGDTNGQSRKPSERARPRKPHSDFELPPLNKRTIGLGLLALVAVWLFSGVYYVDTDEQGVVLRFGKWTDTTAPGLHIHLPYPIETVMTPRVTAINRLEVGYRGEDNKNLGAISRQVPEESLMLTGDENIVDINFALFWRIKDAGLYLFNIRDPQGTIKAVAESAMREVIGQNDIEYVLAEGRGEIERLTKDRAQTLLDEYGTGVEITELQLKRVDPPEQVIEAFRDVQRAKADQERLRNQADAYRNDLLPRARGDAEKIIQQAEAYKNEVVVGARGDADRFNSVLAAYKKGEEITTERIYIETLEEVMKNSNKVIIDNASANAVVPYLPLPEVAKRAKKPEPVAEPEEE